MATQVASIFAVPLVGGRRRKIVCMASWTLAATTGVATAVDTDDPGLTMSRSAAGTYALVYPASPGKVHIKTTIINGGGGTPNISFARVTAVNASAGTATIITTATGAPFTAVDSTETTLTLAVELTIDIS